MFFRSLQHSIKDDIIVGLKERQHHDHITRLVVFSLPYAASSWVSIYLRTSSLLLLLTIFCLCLRAVVSFNTSSFLNKIKPNCLPPANQLVITTIYIGTNILIELLSHLHFSHWDLISWWPLIKKKRNLPANIWHIYIYIMWRLWRDVLGGRFSSVIIQHNTLLHIVHSFIYPFP